MGELLPFDELSFVRLKSRHISAKTCKRMKYGVFNGSVHVACYYHEGKLMYQKTRTADKKFSVLKAPEPSVKLQNLLFGRDTWGDGGGDKLIITEGEIDCLTAVESLGSSGFHCVSISAGAQAAEGCLKSNFDFINGYSSVYLCFDNDEPGQRATEKAIDIIGANKILLFNLGEYKDLNELWVAQGNSGVQFGYHNSKSYRPQGILFGEELWDEVDRDETRGTTFPWDSFNKFTYGLRPHEMLILTAGSGVGKTTVFKSIEAHCISQGLKLGIIHIEEQIRDTVMALMGLLRGSPFESTPTREEFDEFISSSDVVFYDKRKGFDEEAIVRTMEYMVSGLGCDIIFLDHITAIADQYDAGEINQKTRKLISNLGKSVSRLPYTLFMISHLRKSNGKPHEEGGRVHLDDLLGASAIKQWADYVIALERDNQTEDEFNRNRPMARFLKNRHRGEFTGKVVPLEYDVHSGAITEGETIYEQKGKAKGLHRTAQEDTVLPDF